MDAAQAATAVLVGHSFGGYIVQGAARAPQRMRGLVVEGCTDLSAKPSALLAMLAKFAPGRVARMPLEEMRAESVKAISVRSDVTAPRHLRTGNQGWTRLPDPSLGARPRLSASMPDPDHLRATRQGQRRNLPQVIKSVGRSPTKSPADSDSQRRTHSSSGQPGDVQLDPDRLPSQDRGFLTDERQVRTQTTVTTTGDPDLQPAR